jgi:hypothetical protein
MAYYAQPSNDSRFVLRMSAETLSITAYSGETATDADGAVTVGITDAGGAVAVPSGTSATSAGSGVYNYVLQAQSDLKKLTVTWSGTWGGTAMEFTTTTEVVGNFYANVAEVRAHPMLVGETSVFPTTDLVRAISYATSIIDDYVGAPFVQRYRRDVLNGSNDQTIRVSEMYPTTLLSASIDGTALTASEISDCALFEDGSVMRKDKTWTYTLPGNKVILEYEFGSDTTAPEDIRWCARTLAAYSCLELQSRLPDRAVQIQSEFGSITLSQPGGFTRPTPLPDVNVILVKHRKRPPVAF